MARSEIAVNGITLNAGTALTETVVASGATGSSGVALTGVTRDADLRVVVKNVGTATGPVSFGAGDYLGASVGALTSVVGGGVSRAFQLDGARFRQNDGSVEVDMGFTGSIYAFQLAQ